MNNRLARFFSFLCNLIRNWEGGIEVAHPFLRIEKAERIIFEVQSNLW